MRRTKKRRNRVRGGALLLAGLLVIGAAFFALRSREKGPAFSPDTLPVNEDAPKEAENPPEPDPVPEPEPEPEPDPRQVAAEAILSGMSVEEKVGQMFFVRCPDSGAVGKVSQYHLGGYLLFSRDFQDKTAQEVKDTITSYQAETKIPLLTGADEEGGTVVRLSRNKALFSKKFQSPQQVFASGGMEAVRADAVTKSEGLLQYGVNVNFAPVADVSTDANDFIYDRSFGQDAAATAEFVRTVVAAANEVRYTPEEGKSFSIGSVLKHFPGYGNNVDTHTGIAIDDQPYEQFLSEDFLPFQAGIEAGAGSVLVSHNVVNCMDASLPASLSPEVHRILREELGFEGVILTDDLAMDAVEAYAEDGSVAVLAVLAGNDMIVTTDFETQIPLVIDAVKAGLISEELLDAAVLRILSWKYDLGLISVT